MKDANFNVLFVCSMNQWRSPTAEKIYSNRPGINVRSAGTSRKSRRTVNEKDVSWASLIILMERKHEQRLYQRFGPQLAGKSIEVLDVPDQYKFMDPRLVDVLTEAIDPILEKYDISKR